MHDKTLKNSTADSKRFKSKDFKCIFNQQIDAFGNAFD